MNMGMWATLLVLLPVVVIAVLVWNYRRQAAAREAASAERMKAFLDAGKLAKNPEVNSGGGEAAAMMSMAGMAAAAAAQSRPATVAQTKPAPAANATAPAKAPVPLARPQVVTGFTARPQLTSTAQLAVFQLLQSALPGHAVLPRMSLAAFIQPPANTTGITLEAERRRLADISVDFLICNAQLRPLAVVQCATDAAAPSPQTAFAAACAASTGLRWLSLPADPLPTVEEIRQRVLGA